MKDSPGNESFLNELYAYLKKFLSSAVMSEFLIVLEMHKMMSDPNFVRCPNVCFAVWNYSFWRVYFFLLYLIFFVLQMNCFHGFIKRANTKEETCPACKRSFCNECSQIWQVQHLNVTCSAYAKWMKDNCITIADQISIKIDENAENVSKCPKCKFTFILIRLVCCLLLFIAHSSFNQLKII